MNALLQAALDYAKRGFSVFPAYSTGQAGRCSCGRTDCESPGKHPRTPHGHRDASTDAEQIRDWWGRWPDANIGVSCGGSDIAIGDVDEKGGRHGGATWHGLVAEHGPQIEATAIVATPSRGGFHVWYRCDGNRVGSKNDLLGSGIDVKGEGGYIIAPPSAIGGVEYSWVDGHGLDRLADLPKPLAERIAFAKAGSNGKHRKAANTASTAGDAIPEGRRNETLTSLAGTMRRPGMTEDAIEAALLEENAARCTPPLSEREVRAIAKSVASYEPAAAAVASAPFHLTELGNAERLAARHAGSLYVVRGTDELRGYDAARGIYSAEHSLLVRYATDTVRSIYAEAGDALTDEAKEVRKHAARSETKKALDAMLSLAQSLEALQAEVEDFDAEPELLNTQSGVVNLRTGERFEHSPDFRMTKITGCAYAPGAPTPKWDAFLSRIFAGNTELIAFMQRLFGYGLTGYIGEQIFAIFFGAGANGKSTLVDCWQAAMGDYAGVAALSTFLPRRAEAVRTDLATLNGRRLVSTSESRPGQLIDAATIKVLTSKHVTCRFNYQRGEFTYTPQYLVVLDTNFKPQVQCDDYAIKRRVLLVPFGVLIPEEEQDKKLTETLIDEELPGILAWGVAGAADYLAHGLGVPEQVRAATEAYRAEMDALHEFWTEWLVFGDANVYTTAKDLRHALESWAGENGVELKDLPKGTEWGRMLRERGAERGKRRIGQNTVSVWYGVQIVGAEAQESLI